MRLEQRMGREGLCAVVIEIENRNTLLQQSPGLACILIIGNIEYGDPITAFSLSLDSVEQRNVALYAGDQRTLRGIDRTCEAQLMHRANAVCVTIEDIEMAHG